tara:strand:- start:91 stop:225 length:135 start_codon:yes stop_codon:yes gene_type:complete
MTTGHDLSRRFVYRFANDTPILAGQKPLPEFIESVFNCDIGTGG